MFKNEIKIDPKEWLNVVREIERETARTVLMMIKQENGGTISEWIVEKVAMRYGLNRNTF